MADEDKNKEENKEGVVFNQMGSTGIGITILVILLTVVMLIFVVKFIFLVLLGSIVNGFLIITYKLGTFIGKSFEEKNYVPIKWFFGVLAFIVVAIVVGYYLQNLDFVVAVYETLVPQNITFGG